MDILFFINKKKLYKCTQKYNSYRISTCMLGQHKLHIAQKQAESNCMSKSEILKGFLKVCLGA